PRPRPPPAPEGPELPPYEGRLHPPARAEDDAPVRRLHREHDEQEVRVQHDEGRGPPELPDRRDDARAREGPDDDPGDEGVDDALGAGVRLDPVVRVPDRGLEGPEGDPPQAVHRGGPSG